MGMYATKLCRNPAAMTTSKRKNIAVSLIIFSKTIIMVPKNGKKFRCKSWRQSNSGEFILKILGGYKGTGLDKPGDRNWGMFQVHLEQDDIQWVLGSVKWNRRRTWCKEVPIVSQIRIWWYVVNVPECHHERSSSVSGLLTVSIGVRTVWLFPQEEIRKQMCIETLRRRGRRNRDRGRWW